MTILTPPNPAPAPTEVVLDDQETPPPIATVVATDSPRAAVLREAAALHHAALEESNNVKFDIMDDTTGAITPAVPPVPDPAPITAAPVPSPAPDPVPVPIAFDPEAEYDLIVEGQPIKVKGAKILEMGRATIQKEAAADYKLQLASQLLGEAQRRHATLPQRDETPQPSADEIAIQEKAQALELAKAIQFGTQEQAAEAIRSLTASRGKPVDGEQVMNFIHQQMPLMVKDNLAFENAVTWANTEYADLFKNDHLKRYFFSEEDRRRRTPEGKSLPYQDLYKAIGEDLRKGFGLPKTVPTAANPNPPAPTAAARQLAKAALPAVPTIAAARASEVPAPAKPQTVEDIVNRMRTARKQQPLS